LFAVAADVPAAPLSAGAETLPLSVAGQPVDIFHIIFLAASLAVIAATLFFFLRKREPRRFLTTTRLSVLDRMVQKGCRYIESNYADPRLTVEKVCGELVTGETYLDAMFVKEIGIGVQDFIRQVRVNSLKNLLTANPLQDIEKACGQCGFTTRAAAESHFANLVRMGIDEYLSTLPASGKS